MKNVEESYTKRTILYGPNMLRVKLSKLISLYWNTKYPNIELELELG